jgi:hypothetical protein
VVGNLSNREIPLIGIDQIDRLSGFLTAAGLTGTMAGLPPRPERMEARITIPPGLKLASQPSD